MCILEVSGVESPEASKIIKKLVGKSMETCKPLKTFTNYERILNLQSSIVIENKVRFRYSMMKKG